MSLDLTGNATDVRHVGQVPISRMPVAHPVTPIGSPYELSLTPFGDRFTVLSR
jgi:hypothetical protein